jgi:orotidine-5'-phosphate decarboxylase
LGASRGDAQRDGFVGFVFAFVLDGVGDVSATTGPIGTVVGPTHIEPTLDLVATQGLFLAPGVGAQGATPIDVARIFASCPERVTPSTSRSLLAGGPDLSRLRDTAALASEFREALPG